MLSALWIKYKWLIIGLLFVAYTAGVSHVAMTYASAGHTEQMLETEQAKNKALNENIELRDTFSRRLQEDLAKLQPKVTTITNEVQREIQTNTVYRDCKSTDGVRNKYDELLKAQ